MKSSTILEKLCNLNVLVIGDLILDHYVWGDVHRISPEAPVPVVHATRDTYTAGGAANVALNLASLGAKASLIGTVGQDSHADALMDLLAAATIDTTNCIKKSSAPTIVKTRVMARTQQLCRIDREAARDHYAIDLSKADLEPIKAAVATADAVIVSDYAKGLVNQGLLDHIIALASENETFLAIDPKPARHLNLKGADLITPNRHEALELASLPEPEIGEAYPLDEVCRRIHASYAPRLLVITLGADGMAVCQEGRVLKILPTRAREVFDVSGAGDTVIASLTAALAAGTSPLDAATFANQAAGIVVSKVGTATAKPEEFD